MIITYSALFFTIFIIGFEKASSNIRPEIDGFLSDEPLPISNDSFTKIKTMGVDSKNSLYAKSLTSFIDLEISPHMSNLDYHDNENQPSYRQRLGYSICPDGTDRLPNGECSPVYK